MYIDRNLAASRVRKYEELSTKSETEQAGYVPPQIQIENMLLAGHRLAEARRDMHYDFACADEIDEDAYDPTRQGNFDLADATRMAMEAEEAIRAAENQLNAAQAAKIAAQNAQEGSGEPLPDKGA